jgi:hypothetical protein
MKKKIITSLLAAALLVSGTAALAAEDNEVTAINSTETTTTAETVTAESTYTKVEAEAVSVKDNVITVKGEEENTEVTVAEDAAVFNLDGEKVELSDIKEGDALYIYNKNGAEEASVVVIANATEDEETPASVDVDTYVKSDLFGVVTNSANTLALNVDENTDITDLNGEKVEYTDLENKDLIVFYSTVALSLPGQTNPSKVVVLGEAEAAEVVEGSETAPGEAKAAYEAIEAQVVSVKDNVITIKGEEENTEVTVAENAAVLNTKGEVKALTDVKEGDYLYVYNKDGETEASVIVIADVEENALVNVNVDAYAKTEDAVVNAANTLALNVNEDSDITDLKGEKVAYTDIADKYLAVFYTESTKSIPAQTTPDKVVVLGDVEKSEDVETPVVQDPTKVTKVTANGKEICTVTYDSTNKTFMVPVRAIAENLGYTVGWEGGELLVTVGNDTKEVKFNIGVNSYNVNGTARSAGLEKAPELINDTTFVPSSFFSDVLENTVEIDGDTLVIK